MSATDSSDPHRISRWTGEFADRETERRYRAFAAETTSTHVRLAFIVWGVLLFSFALSDYEQFGLGEQFYAGLFFRSVFMLLLATGGWAVSRWPVLATNGVVVTVLVWLGFTSFFPLYFVIPVDNIPWIVGITMICIMSLCVLIPNRFIFSAFLTTYALAGTLVCTGYAVPDTTPSRMIALGVMLMVPAGAGLFAGYRFELARRTEFTALEYAQGEIERRRAVEAELKRQATIDPLTGVYNRRQYEYLFERELDRARRGNRPLSVCVLDLDHFKRVNDTYGHSAGDTALTITADICRSALRDTDIVGRLGGEEFVLILPETDAESAERVAERVRELLAATDVVARKHRFRLTATLGVAELAPGDQGIQDLVYRADEALYEGKRAGRNRVCVAPAANARSSLRG